MLRDEREDTTDYLESEIPNLVIERRLEPVVLKFLPTHEYEVKVLWAIIWDSRNNRLKCDIAVECKDEGKCFSSWINVDLVDFHSKARKFWKF